MTQKNCYIDPAVSKKALQKFFDAFKPEENDLYTLQIYHKGRMLVRIATAPYNADDKREVYSVSKSFTSTAIGFLCDEGKLSVEDRVIDFFPDKLPEVVSENLAKMRVKHLLSMTTGHRDCSMYSVTRSDDPIRTFLAAEVEFEPGTYYCYDTGASCILSCIVERITGMKTLDFLTWKLFLPLGIHGITWNKVRDGNNEGGCGIHISSDDMIKFGLFYANKGKWNGKQLLSEKWIKEATTPIVNSSNDTSPDAIPHYGYQFWRNTVEGYRADGAFGQLILVLPEHEMVIATQTEIRTVMNVQEHIFELADHILDVDDTQTLVLPSFTPIGSAQKTAGFENSFYQLEDNPFGWTGIYFVYDTDNDAMKAVFSNGAAQQAIVAGSGYFAESTVFTKKLKPKIARLMSTPEVELCPLICSYTAEDRKLTFYVRFRTSPHRVMITFAAEGDELSIHLEGSGLFDPEAENLKGHRLSL